MMSANCGARSMWLRMTFLHQYETIRNRIVYFVIMQDDFVSYERNYFQDMASR